MRSAPKLDIASTLRLSFVPILLTLFLMSLLDTLGTLVGLDAATGAVGDLQKPMLVDALSCMFSASTAVAGPNACSSAAPAASSAVDFGWEPHPTVPVW